MLDMTKINPKGKIIKQKSYNESDLSDDQFDYEESDEKYPVGKTLLLTEVWM